MNLIKTSSLIALLALFAYTFTSCKNNNSATNNAAKEIKVDFTAYDFYKDFSNLDTNNLTQGLATLVKKYPEFLPIYIQELAHLNTSKAVLDTAIIKGFLTYPDFRNLFDTVNKVYPNTQKQTEELATLFKNIKYYDSSFLLPQRVYYFAAGLNYAAFGLPNHNLGIGLDMFLGRNFLPYEQIKIPSYLTIRNTPSNIPIAAAKLMYTNNYPNSLDDKKFLEIMLIKGKEMYFLKKVLPTTPDSLLYTITDAQMKWLNKNEALIYNFFLQKNLLYQSLNNDSYSYISEAPTSSGMPAESPGNTGTFIGYKIINAYMNEAHLSVSQLLHDTTDAQTVLRIANYKPD